MDIYGAFQLCSIGILAAPVATMMSKTYFNDPGRNVIFLWTILLLSGRNTPHPRISRRVSDLIVCVAPGLICLAVEFYRIETFDCIDPQSGNVTSPSFSNFTWGKDNTCSLRCSTKNGPFSPIRGGPDDNLYIVPAPDKLTFGTATLLAAACCVHAILCLISMRNKILDNWKERWGRKVNNESLDHVIEHTERATPEMMKSINGRIQFFLKIVAIPVFGGAGLAILIIGEMNFFSRQVRYQTEPISSVGEIYLPISTYYHHTNVVRAVSRSMDSNSRNGHGCGRIIIPSNGRRSRGCERRIRTRSGRQAMQLFPSMPPTKFIRKVAEAVKKSLGEPSWLRR